MNDELRRIFATALAENEPPPRHRARELVEAGRRRRRRQRVIYTGSGVSLAAALVTAAALVVPALTAEHADERDAAATTPPSPSRSGPSDERLENLSSDVAEVFTSRYPDIIYHGESDNMYPFELSVDADYRNSLKLDGIARMPDSPSGATVEVNLYGTGSWENDFGEITDTDVDPDDTDFLLLCGQAEDADVTVDTLSCDTVEQQSSPGQLYSATLRLTPVTDDATSPTMIYRSVLIRPDDTAVALQLTCEGEDCGTGASQTPDPWGFRDLLGTLPDVPS